MHFISILFQFPKPKKKKEKRKEKRKEKKNQKSKIKNIALPDSLYTGGIDSRQIGHCNLNRIQLSKQVL
jgi:hypothetical protein